MVTAGNNHIPTSRAVRFSVIVLTLVAVSALTAAARAEAYWFVSGTGSTTAPVVSTLATSTLSATGVEEGAELSWTAVTPPSSGTVHYYVLRDGGAAAGTCPSAASPTTVTSCTDTGATTGEHSYTVTAVWRSWTAQSSSTSTTVLAAYVDSGYGLYSDISSTGTDTGIPQGGLTAGASGPTQFSGSPQALAFSGSNGLLETPNSITGPQTFSLAAWFKTSSKAGSIIGFTNSQAAAGSTFDRMIWIDSSGHVVFGTFPVSNFELNSEATTSKNYADGNWHFVVVTVTPASSTKGTVEMYVDGALVAGSTENETISGSDPAQVYSGYWHVGWGDESGWPDSPSTSYWSGSLGDVAVFGTALSAASVTTLYGKTTQASEKTQMLADSPSQYWTLEAPLPNNGIASGGVTPRAAGPTNFSDSPTAVSFNGTTGFLETSNSITGPQSFSIAGWFKTSTKAGSIIGFTSAQTTTGSEFDRMVWVDSSGHVVYGVYDAGYIELNSEATTSKNYADGNWHFVVITDAPASATKGTLEMYIDGSLVSGASENETLSSGNTAQVYNGYWHLGWANQSTWTDAPSTSYWSGSLADVAVFPTALTAANVTTLYGETTQASESAQMLAFSPTEYWKL
jgi:ketopantoate hydroxymethyltransferase